MDKKDAFATIEDVIGAAELVYGDKNTNVLASKAFGMFNTISFINFGCIKNTDKVLIISSEIDTITWGISYIYTPQKLISSKISLNEDINELSLLEKKKWRDINELLEACIHTKPNFTNRNIDSVEYEDKGFDVFIAGYINEAEAFEEIATNRFNLQIGIEYDMFEKLINKSKNTLKKDGVLLMLCKPGWILKSWNLIHEIGLQLEYDNYRLYIDNYRNANTYVWLRFVKKEKDLNVDLQKRNVLDLMDDNGIDRLFAHRNNLRFPYVELSYSNSEAYIKLNQNLEYMQYFFSVETTTNLANLCEGYTACLVTPSIAQHAHKVNKNVVLFDRDNRFRENKGLSFVKYDLYIGLTKFMKNKYSNKFNRVICDPPFDIKLDILAKDIVELLKQRKDSIVYIVFPYSRKASLINAMKAKGLLLNEENRTMNIEYAKPPKIVRVYGKQAIQLFKFSYEVTA